MIKYRYVWARQYTIAIYVSNSEEKPQFWHFRGVLRTENGKVIAVRYHKNTDKLVSILESLFHVSQQ